MAITGARKTITTTAAAVVSNSASAGSPDTGVRSYILIPQAAAGIVHLGPPEDGSPLTLSNSVRWDISQGPLSIDLEPGESLTARVETDPLDVDVLAGGR